MEEGLKATEARLMQWAAEIDHLAAKTQIIGIQAGFDALIYVDELKALHAIAQSKLDEFRAAAARGTERARLKAEMRRTMKELEAMGAKRKPTRRTPR